MTIRKVNPEAYQLCLEARERYLQVTRTGLDEAERLYHRALAVEPEFGRALAGLSLVWTRRAVMRSCAARYLDRELTAARGFARRAIDADPAAPDPHLAFAEIASIEGRIRDSEEAYARAIERKINFSEGCFYAFFLVGKGRPDLALVEFAAARQQNPLSPLPPSGQGLAYLVSRQWEQVVTVLSGVDAVLPAAINSATQALALVRLGRLKEGTAKAREALALAAQSDYDEGFGAASDGVAAWALAEAGEREAADAVVQRLLRGRPEHRHYAELALLSWGRVDEAVALMRDRGQRMIPFPLLLCADEPKLRGDPRLREVFKGLNALEALDALTALFDAGAGGARPR